MNKVTSISPEAESWEPHNVEAEQQLLGAILTNNDLAGRAAAVLEPSDFYDPVHARIYEIALAKIDCDEIASPVTIRTALEHDEGLKELGGPAYLVRLAGAAIASFAVADYARLIRDAAARRHALQVLRDAQAALIRGAEATGDVMANLEASLVAMAPADSKMRPTSFLAAATTAVQQIDAARRGDDVPSVAIPWSALRRIVSSFSAGDMVVIGGRPSMGKSAVALSLATAAAWDGHPVVFASLEMTPEAVAMRALSEATSNAGDAVSYKAMRDGDLEERQFRTTIEAAKELESLPIQFLTENFSKPGALRAGVKQALRMIGPMGGKTPLLIVDYMQLMDGVGKDDVEKISHISKQMKHIAKSVGAVNIALSQLSRKVEERHDKRPVLSDLRQSGQIEQDADTIIFCYRDEYYIERERPDTSNPEKLEDWERRCEAARGKLELIVAKQRSGPIGTAHLRSALKFNRIWD